MLIADFSDPIPEQFRFPYSTWNPYCRRLAEFPGIVFQGAQTEVNAGRWRRDVFGVPETTKLYFEIGCGNGHFLASQAAQHPDRSYVGLEYGYKPLYHAARKLRNSRLNNARLLSARAERLPWILGEEELDGAHILFSDPWPRPRDAEKRLLSLDFFQRLGRGLKRQGTVWVKTDQALYFSWFEQQITGSDTGFKVRFATYDLHASQHAAKLDTTHFERIFLKQGLAICFMELIKE